jgi:hypothetical protein
VVRTTGEHGKIRRQNSETHWIESLLVVWGVQLAWSSRLPGRSRDWMSVGCVSYHRHCLHPNFIQCVVKGVARLTNHFLVKESLRNHLAVLQECAPTREIIGLGDKISDSNAATAIR